MKLRTIKICILSFSLSALISCSQTSQKNEVPTLDIVGQLNTPPLDNLDQSKWNVKEIPMELTDSTILSGVSIAKVDDKAAWVYDLENVFRFSASTGKCEHIFNRRGQGPEEYYSILSAKILNSGEIAINDFNTRLVSLYTPEGSFKARSKVEVGDIVPVADGIEGISFPGTCPLGTMAYRFNNTLNPTDSTLLGPNPETTKGFVRLYPFMEFNGRPTLQMNDTLFSLENIENKKPLLCLHTGSLHLPAEIEDDFHRLSERADYINSMYAVLWKSLAFVCYCYKEDIYYDVWDIEKEKLIFRNKGTIEATPQGFPLEMGDGKVVNVWPTYSDKDSLIGLIPAETDSSSDDEQNPGIFIISQK